MRCRSLITSLLTATILAAGAPFAFAHGERYGSTLVTTDGQSTAVSVMMRGRRIECVKITTNAGYTRHVWVTFDGSRHIDVRVLKNRETRCIKPPTSVQTSKNTPVRVRVVEDLPGPFNVVSYESFLVP